MENNTVSVSNIRRATESQCKAIAARFSCLPEFEPVFKEDFDLMKQNDPSISSNYEAYKLLLDFMVSWSKADKEEAALNNGIVQEFLGSEKKELVLLDDVVPGLHQYLMQQAEEKNIDMSAAAYKKQTKYSTQASPRPASEVLQSYLATLTA